MVHRHISDDIKEMVLAMSLQGISDFEVCQLTGVSEHSLKQLQSMHWRTGNVLEPYVSPGWQHALLTMEVKVHQFVFEQQTSYDFSIVPL